MYVNTALKGTLCHYATLILLNPWVLLVKRLAGFCGLKLAAADKLIWVDLMQPLFPPSPHGRWLIHGMHIAKVL